jgi:hypothetical protein
MTVDLQKHLLEVGSFFRDEFLRLDEFLEKFQSDVNVFADTSTIIACLIAALAIGITLIQWRRGRRRDLASLAYSHFHDYEVRCFENPKFANPDDQVIDFTLRLYGEDRSRDDF